MNIYHAPEFGEIVCTCMFIFLHMYTRVCVCLCFDAAQLDKSISVYAFASSNVPVFVHVTLIALDCA